MLEFRSGGRRVSLDQFFENLKKEAIEAGMKQLEQRAHAAAASIVAKLIDPLKGADSSPWTMVAVHVTDRTRRFVRDHG